MRKIIFFLIILCIPLGMAAQCLGGDCPPSSKYNKNTKQKSKKNFSLFKKKKNKKRKSKDRNFDSKVSSKPKKHKIKPPIPDANPDGIWSPSNY